MNATATQMTREDAERLLAPLLDTIRDCIADAIREYRNLDSGLRWKLRKRSRSSMINDFMAFNARSRLAGLEGVYFSEYRGLFSVYVGDGIRLRFKKLDSRLRPSYIPTGQANDFMCQVNPPMLDGMPVPPTNLIAGYRVETMPLSTPAIYVVCPDGKRNAWELRVNVDEAPQDIASLFGQAVSPLSRSPKSIRVRDSRTASNGDAQ